jgi:hypothetical protein
MTAMPPTPASQPPFGEPPGETIYSNAPSYKTPLPPDVTRSRTWMYVTVAAIAIALVALGGMAAAGMI